MERHDIEFLRYCLETAPECHEMVRLDPPAAFLDGRWRPVEGLKTIRGRVRLRLQGGRAVLLPAGGNRGEWGRSTTFWEPILRTHFPRARILRQLTGTDRTRHQSAAFTRTLVREGRHEKALIWVPPEAAEESRERLLSSLVLWWAELSAARRPKRAVCFIPDKWSRRIVAGFCHLRLPLRCYQYRLTSGSGAAELKRIYPAPANRSAVQLPYVIFPRAESAPGALRELALEFPQLCLSRRAAGWELDFRGLPVVWHPAGARRPRFNHLKPSILDNVRGFRQHLDQVEHYRRCPGPDPGHPFYSRKPERWLEHEVIRDHRLIETDFGREIYAQVPSCMDGERKILDLVSCTWDGRLAVIELKASQDLNLIFQALEYWSRVGVHLERGDFQQLGYFPSQPLLLQPPLLYVVCPLFDYHRVLPVFRKFLNPNVKFRCIGVNSDWRRGLRVMRRFDF